MQNNEQHKQGELALPFVFSCTIRTANKKKMDLKRYESFIFFKPQFVIKTWN